MENLINWKMFVDKKTGLYYIQNIADEWIGFGGIEEITLKELTNERD